MDAFRPVPRYQETWTETVPAEVGASRLNASLYRSITRPLPQAHQSISFTYTQLPDPHTVTVRPRQLPTRSAGPAAAYSPPGYPLAHELTPALQYQLAVPRTLCDGFAGGFGFGVALSRDSGRTG